MRWDQPLPCICSSCLDPAVSTVCLFLSSPLLVPRAAVLPGASSIARGMPMAWHASGQGQGWLQEGSTHP